MTALTLQKEITKAIRSINDEGFLLAIHTIVKNRNNAIDFNWSETEKKLLDHRKAQYKAGKLKTYSPAQMRKKLLHNLQP